MIGLSLLLACTSSPSVDTTPDGADTNDERTPPEPGPIDDVFVFDGPRPTNLLVISMDTVRWDRVGRYANDPTLTPFLDERLEESVVLDRHHSCSNWTAPSMLCATSGLNPVDVGEFIARDVADLPTVALQLRAAGYATRLATGNGYFFGEQDALGFDEVMGRDPSASALVADVLTLEAALPDGSPWYLHGHFFDPHKPLCPPEDYMAGKQALPSLNGFDLCWDYRETLNAMWRDGGPDEQAAFRAHVEFRYGAEMRYMDDQLRVLWTELDARGALDDTLVVFMSDHGEQFMERRPVVDHPWDLFAEENRAIAAFWAKNLSGRPITTRTQHEDIAATLYTLFGVVPDRPIRGLPVGTAPEDRPLWLVHDHNGENIVAVVKGDQQLTVNFNGQRFFHDLAADPTQKTNLYDGSSPEVAALWQDLAPLLDQVDQAFPSWDTPDRTP